MKNTIDKQSKIMYCIYNKNTTLNHGGFRNGKINKRSVRKI